MHHGSLLFFLLVLKEDSLPLLQLLPLLFLDRFHLCLGSLVELGGPAVKDTLVNIDFLFEI